MRKQRPAWNKGRLLALSGISASRLTTLEISEQTEI